MTALPLKIALVTTNLKGGGAEKALTKLASVLARRGHAVHLILLEDIREHEPDAALAIHALTRPGQAAGKGLVGKLVAAARLRRVFFRLSRGGPFDLVVSTLPYADEVVSIARLPRVWYRIANTLSAEIEALRRSNPAKAERRLARYRKLYDGKNLIAVSQGVADDLRAKLGLKKANIVRIYNVFEADRIRRLAEEDAADIPSEPYVIHVGRFAPQKRHDLLLRAWKIAGLPHKLVLLANPSETLDAMLAQHQLKDQVIVAGFQRNPYPWIGRADALVLCSDHEGLPNVLIEALICGTPIVSTDCPSGPREIMTGALARFLVPMNDAEALAGALRQAVESPAALPADFLEKFEADAIAQAYEGLPGCWSGIS